MFGRKNVYAKVDEKFVKTVVLYADSSDKLFYDEAAKSEAVKTADLLELFLKGVTVVKTGVYYKAIAFKSNGIVGHDGSAAATFTGV